MSHSVTPSWWTPSTSAQLTELAISGETFQGCAGKLLAVQSSSYRQPGSDLSCPFQTHRGLSERQAESAGVLGGRQRGQGELAHHSRQEPPVYSQDHRHHVVCASGDQSEDHHHKPQLSEAGQRRVATAGPDQRQRGHPVDH